MEKDPDLVPSIEKLMLIIESIPENISKECEIEVRLGFLSELEESECQMFDSNIGEQYFNKILSTLREFKEWREIETTTTTDYYADNLRLTVAKNGSKSCMEKNRIKDIDFTYDETPFDIRISVSQEIPKDPSEFPKSKKKITKTRRKNRTSFHHEYWTFDITEVIKSEDDIESTSYEIELELNDCAKALKENPGDVNVMWIAHSTMLKLRQLVYMCETPSEETQMIFIKEKIKKAFITKQGKQSPSKKEEIIH